MYGKKNRGKKITRNEETRTNLVATRVLATQRVPEMASVDNSGRQKRKTPKKKNNSCNTILGYEEGARNDICGQQRPAKKEKQEKKENKKK